MVNSLLPIRLFSILVDPETLENFRGLKLVNELHLLANQQSPNDPIKIELLLPLADDLPKPTVPRIRTNTGFKSIPIQRKPYEFALGQQIKGQQRKALLGSDKEAANCRMLLSIAQSKRVDGVVTEASPLIQARYSLYQDHLIRIVPLHEFEDLCEIIAHGHSIFWAATDPYKLYTPDLFYQMAHWKGSRLAKCFFSLEPSLGNDSLKETLRTALLQRYPFGLYARDMTRFYELQMDYFTRRGLARRFFLQLGYHVNNFYLHLWGMLDQLTLVAKHSRSLPVTENKCGITSDDFWDEFKRQEQSLSKFVRSAPIHDWIRTMSDMRHRAAHNVIPMPTELLMDTPESRKSDEEIWDILKKEDSDTFSILPGEILETMKPTMIAHWRIDKMKRVMKDVVVFKRKDGMQYFRSPVLSIDHDLMYLNAIIDTFLVTLFAKKNPPKVPQAKS